jgi:PLD-like domain
METQAFFENIQAHIQTRLLAAEKEIDLAVAWFTDRLLFETVCQKAKKGVTVRLLLFDDDINQYLSFQDLVACGGKLFRISEKLMHNKFCVIDRDVVISGSYNWTKKAREDNYENITITTGDPLFALQFVQEFDRIVERHFGEKQATNTDFSAIVKRLELILSMIELGDTDDLPPQYRKLKSLHLPSEIGALLPLLEAQRYGDAVARITDFIARFRQIQVFVDPEIAALQLEMHALELDISNLENEKSEVEKTIYDFEIQYNRALGQLLMAILAVRRQIAAAHAAAQPDDSEAQERQKETDNDYQSYHNTYEATRAKPLSPLTTDEKQLLKNRFREATKLCHPDTVAEAFKEKAQAVFIELKQAYDENNLERVTTLLDYLKHGKPYQAEHTALTEKRHLRTVIDRLRHRRAQLLDALHGLRTHETFAALQNITDWNTYFDNQKAALEARLEKLNEEWTRINK